MAITPQTSERSVGLIEERRLAFDLLTDRGNMYAHQLGLRHELPEDLRKLYLKFGVDLAESNGESSWTLPMAARYVIDKEGVVHNARVDADYTRRPEPAETLEALRSLKA